MEFCVGGLSSFYNVKNRHGLILSLLSIPDFLNNNLVSYNDFVYISFCDIQIADSFNFSMMWFVAIFLKYEGPQLVSKDVLFFVHAITFHRFYAIIQNYTKWIMHDHHKLPHDIAMKRFRNKCGGALCTLKLLLFKLMYWDYLETQIIIRYWAAHVAFIEGLALLFMVVITRCNAATVLLNHLLYLNIQCVP